MSMKSILAAPLLFAGTVTPAMADQPYVAAVTHFMDTEVKNWLTDPIIIDAIKSQNQKHAEIDQDSIDELDKQWRAEVDSIHRSGPMIESVMSNAVSRLLEEKQEKSHGLITEIFIMDDKGLNVGQSAVTSDYWQGDENKFQKTFEAGNNALFVDEVEKDESTQQLQAQASMTINDEDGKPIGAITVGINLEEL